jgi:type I restriction enzyme S subunit
MAFTTPIPELIERNPNGLLGKHPSWERVRLGDIATVQNGAAFKSESFNTEGRGMPLLRIRDIVPGTTETWYDGPYEDEYIVQPGDLVIGMDGDFNHALWNGPPALLNQRVCRLVFHGDAVSKDWILHVLGGYLEAVNDATPSVTVKHLSSRTVADLLLPLPGGDEQRRILQALQRHIERIREGEAAFGAATSQVPTYRNSVLAAAVTGQLTDVESRGESAHSALERMLELRRSRWLEQGMGRYSEPTEPSPRRDLALPSGWTWATVDQVAIGIQYGTSSKTAEGLEGGVPVLRMGNIVDGRLDLTDLKYLPPEHDEFPTLFLREGELLFNRTNSPELVGKTAVIRGLTGPHSFASYLIRVRVAPEVEPEWVAFWLNSPYGRAWVRDNVSQQVGQANFNGTKLRALTLPLAPPHVQRSVREEVSRLLAAGESLAGELADAVFDAATLRRSLLQAAVTGALVEPTTTDGEAAAALLQQVEEDKMQRDDEARKARNKRRAVPVGS